MIRFKEFFDGIKNFFNYGIDDKKIIGQGNQTDALVESVKICWWITADKPIKLIPSENKGREFHHIIKIRYVVDEIEYTSKKIIWYRQKLPEVNDRIQIYYDKKNPKNCVIKSNKYYRSANKCFVFI